MGLTADVGALQRLPKIVGNYSLLGELAYTGRSFDADDAVRLGTSQHMVILYALRFTSICGCNGGLLKALCCQALLALEW